MLKEVSSTISRNNYDIHYGLLIYSDTNNLGDEIQSLAARQFLPRVDYLLDRERLRAFRPDHPGERVKCILNGWFCHHPEHFAFMEGLDPLLTSMHVTGAAMGRFASPDVLSYLRNYGKIGARDLHTLDFLRSLGLDSFFSGCMTLTLERPDVPRTRQVVVNDLPHHLVGHVQKLTSRNLLLTRHGGYDGLSYVGRLGMAEELLRTYAGAHAVVTTRLHCAMPCIAMETPVLLIANASDPERFNGLYDLVHHCSEEDFLSGRFDWNPDNPPPNPGKHTILRHDLKRRAMRFLQPQVAMA